MKKKVVALALAAVMALSAAGCSNGTLDGNATVIEMGDTKITADVANFFARYQQAQYETYYAGFMGEDMWSGEAEEGKTYEESVKEGVLDSLKTLCAVEAHKKDYEVELTEAEEAAIKEAAADFGDVNGLDEKEAISGDVKTVEKMLRLLTVQEKMRVAMTADVSTEVSDEEAAQKSMQYVYFPYTRTDENDKSVQLTDEEKKALKTEAEEFRAGAAEAADFAAFAGEKGYEASTVTFDGETTAPSQALVLAANALGEGETTTVVEDTAGLFVGKVTSLLDREATDKEKENIIAERKDKQFKDLTEKWMKDGDLKVKESTWKKISFVKQGVTVKNTSTEGTESEK